MLLLLMNSPICRFPCQAQPVSAHEMPRSINESTNNFNRACVKIQNSGIFCILECFFVGFAISVFAPAPVLKKIQNYRFRNHKLLTISIGFSLQWNFGKKMHSWPASRIKVSSFEGWFLKNPLMLSRRKIIGPLDMITNIKKDICHF